MADTHQCAETDNAKAGEDGNDQRGHTLQLHQMLEIQDDGMQL